MMSRDHRCFARWSVFAVLAMVLGPGAGWADAQIGTAGAFVGSVQDASGAVLPGATVVATHLATGQVQTAVTGGNGRFRLPSLPLGEYRLEASMDGFQTDVQEGLVLAVGRTIEVKFQLQVGQQTETVNVRGEAALVDTSSSSVVGLVSGQEVRDLPLNGRSFDQLITLSAGTVAFATRQSNAARGTGNMFATAGSRPNTTKFLIDGAEFSGAGAINTTVSSASGKMLGVEGIAEFAVITNSGDASYGKKPGGQVSVVTRSGTNAYHGTGFAFIRDEAFDARNYFDPADEPKPPLSQHNYGGAVGGPIVRNKAFFFTNVEQFQEQRDLTVIGVVPTAAVRAGRFPDGTVIPVNPASQPLLDLYPAPSGRDFGDGTAESIQGATRKADDTFFVVRGDVGFSPSNSVFSRYMIQTGDRQEPNDGLGRFLEANPFRNQLLSAGYKRIFSSRLLNQATVAYNRSFFSIDFIPAEGVTVPDVMILVPGETHHGGITIAGAGGGGIQQIPTLGGEGTLGTAGRFVTRQLFQVSDQFNFTTGAHYVQTGFELQRIHSDEFQGAQARGVLEFTDLKALVAGRPASIRGPLPGSDAFRNWRQSYFGVYAQDSWQAMSNVTLNFGLRWEYNSNPYDTEGRTTAFVPEGSRIDGAPLPLVPPVVPKAFAENKSGNFAPRVGFAWNLRGDGRTAVRGGFGLFYAQIENEFRRTNGAAAPFYNRVTVRNPPFPNSGDALAAGRAGRLAPLGMDQAPNIPLVKQFNVRFEQALGDRMVVAAGYVGSRGTNQVRSGNPQMPPPFLNADGRLEVPNTIVTPTHSANAVFIVWDATNAYNGLQLELERRMSRGLRFKAAFTWSKAVDEGLDPNSAPDNTSDISLVLADRSIDRGRTAYDVTRRLVVNWNYDLPLGTRTGLAGALLNDWGIGGIFQAQDGYPFSVLTGVSQIWPIGGNDSDRPDLVPGASANPVLGGPDQYYDPAAFQLQPPNTVGNVGLNTLRGPGLALLDLSIMKSFHLPGDTAIEFRWEVFNALNRANFGVPDLILFNSDGTRRGAAGRIKDTLTTAREMQFSLKFIF